MKFKISFLKIYYYVVIIAFLFPKGFSELNTVYHRIGAGIIWLSVLLIVIIEGTMIAHKVKIKYKDLSISIYFILAFVITFFCRHLITSGLQQIFAVPAFCIFIIVNMRKHPRILLESFISVYIVEFTLNIFFMITIFKNMYHLTFLGHVQMISQLGSTALFTAALYWTIYQRHKKKIFFLISITLLTMFTTDADSAVLAATILCVAYITYKWKLYNIFCFKTEIYLVVMIFLSLSVIYMTAINRNIIPNLNFSGRKFVWADALLNISNSLWVGYGVDGVLLHTFWTVGISDGFNYAHNQILQTLLDGGVILTIAFWKMIFTFALETNHILNKKCKILSNAYLITILVIMIFDSTTLYCYMYIGLAMIYVFPSLENTISFSYRYSKYEKECAYIGSIK